MVYRYYFYDLRARHGVLWAFNGRHEATQTTNVRTGRTELYSNAIHCYRCPKRRQAATMACGWAWQFKIYKGVNGGRLSHFASRIAKVL